MEPLITRATAHHRAGNLAEAARLYQRIVGDSPTDAAAWFGWGLVEFQQQRPDTALQAISRAIAAAPDQARYHLGLGEVLASLQRWDDAAAANQRATELAPASADAHFALGRSLQAKGDYAKAIASFETATDLQPDRAETLNNLGNCHQLRGDLPGAEQAYRQALALRPAHAAAMSNLGTVLMETDRAEQAIELFRAAAELEPAAPQHAVNLGSALCRRRQFDQAAAVLRIALQLDPAHADAAYNLGLALHGLGRLRESAAMYDRAIQLRPNFAGALNNLGNVCSELGESKRAMAAYEAAMAADPGSIHALNNASCLLRRLGRLEEAEAILRRGFARHPGHPVLYNNLANLLKDSGELDQAIDCFRRAVALSPADWEAHGNLAYARSFQSPQPQPILDECRRWNQRHAAPLRPQVRPHRLAPPRRRLRIGYVSPDFRDHCQSLFTIPLLSSHDHENFEIVCYSSVERPDQFTRRLAGHADLWREVRHLDDAALAETIRADGIDILVDLTMHMAAGRPLLFARKPAPIQVAWLAYPGTTGIETMDYRLSDPRLDPPGFDAHYTERTIRLPDSFWCYHPLTDEPAVNALPALTSGQITLGCLNNPCKLTDHTLRLWSGVMRALPAARLVLMAPPGNGRQHLLRRLQQADIAASRVEFLPFRPRNQYLRSYHQIDLGLDTFPYNGHTTSLDALWMGVPVVSRVGQTCVGRGGLSQLFQLDLLELAAETDEAFVAAAAALASDLPRLTALRGALRTRLQRSPLMDAPRFCRNIEAAYRQMAAASRVAASA